MAANKKPTGGHVVYDSGTDITTGKKRAGKYGVFYSNDISSFEFSITRRWRSKRS